MIIDPQRIGAEQLDLLTYLSPTPASLHDLAEDLGTSWQAVSQRIQKLRDAGIQVDIFGKRASIRRCEFPAIYQIAQSWLDSHEPD